MVQKKVTSSLSIFTPHFSLLPSQCPWLPSPFPFPVSSCHKATMEDELQTTQHSIPAHGDVILTVVYTNQESIVDANLAIFESLLDFEV
jgi:hypothetical protein